MFNIHSVAYVAVLVGYALSATTTNHHGHIRGVGWKGELQEEEKVKDAKTTAMMEVSGNSWFGVALLFHLLPAVSHQHLVLDRFIL